MTIPSTKRKRKALGGYHFVFSWKFKVNTMSPYYKYLCEFLSLPPLMHQYFKCSHLHMFDSGEKSCFEQKNEWSTPDLP